mmetsp:Transcript_27094/g.45158  ORF Transcript_27094/g.45158 Transcript_27094/m.45158 type:complete len:122 (+) Transcript_27094:59-424(+)
MAQGSGKKMSSCKKSGGAVKRKSNKNVNYKGPRKIYKAKGRKSIEARDDVVTAKAINKKNEAICSAKAMASGTRFYLNDVKAVGKKELSAQEKIRNKKHDHEKKLTGRLREQLRKLGREDV